MSGIDRKDVFACADSWVTKQATDVRIQLDMLIPKILNSNSVGYYSVSNVILNEVAYNCAKDLVKISIYQKDKVDPMKIFGYMGFWIRKLKPIESATINEVPCKDINEKISVWLVAAMVTRYFNSIKNYEACRVTSQSFHNLLNTKSRMDYLIHCMRARTFGPHHYVILLQQMANWSDT